MLKLLYITILVSIPLSIGLLSSCSTMDFPAPEDVNWDQIQITTSVNAYEANQSQMVISYTYENFSDVDLFIQPCGPGRTDLPLEKKVSDTWILGYDTTCPEIGGVSPIVLKSGGKFESEQTILLVITERGGIWHVPAIEGIYRLVDRIYTSPDFEQGFSKVFSNSFEIQ